MSDTKRIQQQFFHSLKLGTGEAYLIQRDNPDIDFSNLIIKGAIRNYALDQQSEGSRAVYILGLIRKSKQRVKIIKAVLKKLKSQKGDDYALDQMCDLAVSFYKWGHKEAKTVLYDRFEKGRLDDYVPCGQNQVMEVGGMEGVLKVAEALGKNLLADPEDYENSWPVDEFQKKHKSLSVYTTLEQAGQHNPAIKAYYDSILKHKWKAYRPKKQPRFTYEILKERMEKKIFHVSKGNASQLTVEEVEKLANEFLNETNPKRQELYLHFFTERKFPLDHKYLLKIATGRVRKQTRLTGLALESLKYFNAPEIRQLALEKLSKAKDPAAYLYLLVSNYETGDYRLLCEVANRTDNYDYIHSIAYGFIEIYQANPTAECKEPLEIIYNKMNCGIHREDIVQLLSDNNVLSDKLINEIRFDSYDGVRALFRKSKRKMV